MRRGGARFRRGGGLHGSRGGRGAASGTDHPHSVRRSVECGQGEAGGLAQVDGRRAESHLATQVRHEYGTDYLVAGHVVAVGRTGAVEGAGPEAFQNLGDG